MSTQRTELLYHCYTCNYIDTEKGPCPKCGGFREKEVYEY